MPAHHVRGSANKENRREHGGGLKRNASAAKSSFGPPKGSHPSAVSFEVWWGPPKPVVDFHTGAARATARATT